MGRGSSNQSHRCLSCIHCRVKFKFPEVPVRDAPTYPHTNHKVEVFCRKGAWLDINGKQRVFKTLSVIRSGGKALHIAAPIDCDFYEEA